MSDPTCWALCCRVAGCLSRVGTYQPGTVCRGAGCLSSVRTIPARHCVAGLQAVSAVSEPTCQALCCRGAGCLRCVGTYQPGTVLHGCRLFKPCRNLPARPCVAGVQAVKVVLEPTCRALCCRGAGCLSGVGSNLQGTVLQGCMLFKLCQNLPAWYCVCRGAVCLSSVRTYLPSTVL